MLRFYVFKVTADMTKWKKIFFLTLGTYVFLRNEATAPMNGCKKTEHYYNDSKEFHCNFCIKL